MMLYNYTFLACSVRIPTGSHYSTTSDIINHWQIICYSLLQLKIITVVELFRNNISRKWQFKNNFLLSKQ